MASSKRFIRFCGIDVAKNKHVMCVIDRDGTQSVRLTSFRNNNDGYKRMLVRLKQTGKSSSVLTGMEATGHYWYSLHDFLGRNGYTVAVLNPIQTAQQSKKSIRKRKTDKYDAFHIAKLLRSGDYKPATVPSELGMTCRQLTRLRFKMLMQQKQIKQLLWSRIHPVWPEYKPLFANPFSVTGRTLLRQAPTPREVLKMKPENLAEMIRSSSRSKFGPLKATEIRDAAQQSVGMLRGLDATAIGINCLLDHLEAMEPIRRNLEDQITDLSEKLPGYLFTLPGASEQNIVSLYGEVDPIETFSQPSQLVAFAGLDASVFQTGQYDSPVRHISKRGSPFLRRTLWTMAHRAVYQEGDLRQYWLKKKSEKKHHLVAVTAVARKLCHIVWRIMTDRRDYITKGYNPKR